MIALVFLFTMFMGLVCWSLINNISQVIARDTFELHRPFYYALLIFYPLLFRWNNSIIKNRVFKPILYIIIIQLIIGSLHAIHPSWFEDIIIIYTKKANSISHRVTGTFGNPYDYGIFMIFSFILSAYYAIKVRSKIIYYLFALFCLLAVLLSQSKIALYIVITAIMYALLFCVIHSRKKFINLMLIIVLLSSVLTLSYIYKDNLLYKIKCKIGRAHV